MLYVFSLHIWTRGYIYVLNRFNRIHDMLSASEFPYWSSIKDWTGFLLFSPFHSVEHSSCSRTLQNQLKLKHCSWKRSIFDQMNRGQIDTNFTTYIMSTFHGRELFNLSVTCEDIILRRSDYILVQLSTHEHFLLPTQPKY